MLDRKYEERCVDITKDDLKEGMILKFKNGNIGLLIGDSVFGETALGFTRICKTDDILSNLDSRVNGYEIIEVYRIIDGQYICGLLGILRDMPKHNLKLLWRRGKREIDWSKVPKWTKVQVRDWNNSEWKNAYFLGYDKTFYATRYDRFTFNGVCFAQWKQCRIHETVKIKEEWYK